MQVKNVIIYNSVEINKVIFCILYLKFSVENEVSSRLNNKKGKCKII